MVRNRIVVTIVVMTLALGACGGASESNDSSVAGTEGFSPLDDPINTVQSGQFDVDEVDGGPMLLWFWAPWCVICRHEAPQMAELASTLDHENPSVVMLGVAGRGSLNDMKAFVDDTGTHSITHLADLDGAIWESYGVISQPAYAFISGNGEVEIVNGTLTPEQLRLKAIALVEE